MSELENRQEIRQKQIEQIIKAEEIQDSIFALIEVAKQEQEKTQKMQDFLDEKIDECVSIIREQGVELDSKITERLIAILDNTFRDYLAKVLFDTEQSVLNSNTEYYKKTILERYDYLDAEVKKNINSLNETMNFFVENVNETNSKLILLANKQQLEKYAMWACLGMIFLMQFISLILIIIRT